MSVLSQSNHNVSTFSVYTKSNMVLVTFQLIKRETLHVNYFYLILAFICEFKPRFFILQLLLL